MGVGGGFEVLKAPPFPGSLWLSVSGLWSRYEFSATAPACLLPGSLP